MILFLKIILAHLIGDFIFQPDSWVMDKNKRKIKSSRLYLHVGVHAILLALLLEFDTQYWVGYLAIIGSHFIIDIIKANMHSKKYSRELFFIDQILHVLIIAVVAYIYQPIEINNANLLSQNNLLLAASLIMVTYVSAVVIKVAISKWSPDTVDENAESLARAGRFIGILERLFVFAFVVTNHWEAIGFLLAAKSVFRFGDLKESKDRKLTEYILIGTLLSFGLAILVGVLYLKFVQP